MNFTIYNKISGKIITSGLCQDIAIQPFSSEEDIIPIASDCQKQYVVNGVIVNIPPKPEGFYVFNYVPKQWELDFDAAESSVKSKRSALLFSSDWTQLADIPQETKLLWEPYRQALRDVTSQPGYPYSIVWPTPPTA